MGENSRNAYGELCLSLTASVLPLLCLRLSDTQTDLHRLDSWLWWWCCELSLCFCLHTGWSGKWLNARDKLPGAFFRFLRTAKGRGFSFRANGFGARVCVSHPVDPRALVWLLFCFYRVLRARYLFPYLFVIFFFPFWTVQVRFIWLCASLSALSHSFLVFRISERSFLLLFCFQQTLN